MSKIQKISITNFKAISEFEADFNGCTAIVTAGNNKGKSSFLRGIPDRIRFIRPDVMVKDGATKGKGEMTLTTGEKFIWEFDAKGQDKLVYVPANGKPLTATKEFGKTYFPAVFDIDKFLQSAPKEQSKQLQALVGLDFTTLDAQYKLAYDDRELKNREARNEKAKLPADAPSKVLPVDLTDLQSKKDAIRKQLNDLYTENVNKNKALRESHTKACAKVDTDLKDYNQARDLSIRICDECEGASKILFNAGLRSAEMENFVQGLKNDIPEVKFAQYPAEPTYVQEMPDDSELKAIDEQILTASQINNNALAYTNYLKQCELVEATQKAATEADERVKAIELERKNLIASAKLPEGLAFTPDGVTVDGLPLDNNQISTSKKYIAALKLGALNLGEVKSLYFDASFLDRNSLKEVEQWASAMDYQLLIERPDFDAGDMRIEIIENPTVKAESGELFTEKAA